MNNTFYSQFLTLLSTTPTTTAATTTVASITNATDCYATTAVINITITTATVVTNSNFKILKYWNKQNLMFIKTVKHVNSWTSEEIILPPLRGLKN